MQFAALVLMLAQAAPAVAPGPASPPQPAHAGPFVALDVVQGPTLLGTITIALDEEKAPLTVANFLKYVRAQHYDGTIFHRVVPTFVIQGGNFTPEMESRTNGPAIVNEAKNGLRNSRGTVAMARLPDPDSATDQFFINLKDNHLFDYGISGAGYAVFGEVINGMDVVDRIALVPTTSRGQHQNVPEVSVIIKLARELKTAPGPQPAAPKPSVPEPAASQAAAPKP